MNLRLPALGAVAACAILVPLAAASAGRVGGGSDASDTAVRSDRTAVRVPRPESHRLLDPGLATAARCGPELASPDGVEAQTCVLTQGADTWARTYYRNATGRALDAALSLMGPGGRTVQMWCTVSAHDEPASCETPREPTRGAPDRYTAVAEFADTAPDAPLLLRSGSNSGSDTGS
ncbi:hypothetical protein [Streptomyces sp. NPDC018693]|uniref:hypothetical protein n=1 Tax=unclassified Streptomyces TaxID=2593676 RepID=UPI0037A614B2